MCVCVFITFMMHNMAAGSLKNMDLKKKKNNNRNLTVQQHRRRYTGYEGRSRRGPEKVCGDGILELLCIHRI